MSLTDKQRRFVEEYLVDCNATQAAIRAGYSKNGAEVAGHRLLSNVNVRAAIDANRKATSEKLEITKERVLGELAKIGFSDIRKMFSPGGNLLPIQDLDDDAAACLSSIEVITRKVPGAEESEVEHVSKIKVWDKRAALVDIGKHLGMFVERHEHTGKDGGPIETADMSERDMAKAIAFTLARGERPTAH